jgi:diguanylate cyclase (GGDEF)-like protein
MTEEEIVGINKPDIDPLKEGDTQGSDRFKPLTPEDIEDLTSEELVTYAKKATLVIEDMRHLNKELENRSLHDPLTHVFNKAGIFIEAERIKQKGGKFSILFIDLGSFKDVNDEFGHIVGDKLLVQFADDLKAVALRTGDTVGRFGGDEFIMILPDTDIKGAAKVKDRLGRLLKTKKESDLTDNEYSKIVTDIGIARWDPDSGESIEELIIRADQSMYEEKENRKSKSKKDKL